MNELVDLVDWSRAQFALTAMVHCCKSELRSYSNVPLALCAAYHRLVANSGHNGEHICAYGP